MTAEEFFEWARACSRDLVVARGRLSAAWEPRGSAPMVAGGSGTHDPMAGVDAAMDREAEILATVAYYERVRDNARRVANEVGMALGLNAKLALELYYLDLNTWDDIALELHISIATVYRIRRQAFELVDYRGLVRDAGRQS